MKYNIQAQSYYLEIDFTSLIKAVRSVQSDIYHNGSTIETQEDADQVVERYNKQIIQSNIGILAKTHKNSLSSFMLHSKLIEKPTGIHLEFSIHNDNGKNYHYDIFIMKNVYSVIKRKMIFLKSFKMILDDESLQSDMIQKSLTYGVKNFRTTSNFHIDLGGLAGAILALVFIFYTTGISTSFANFF